MLSFIHEANILSHVVNSLISIPDFFFFFQIMALLLFIKGIKAKYSRRTDTKITKLYKVRYKVKIWPLRQFYWNVMFLVHINIYRRNIQLWMSAFYNLGYWLDLAVSSNHLLMIHILLDDVWSYSHKIKTKKK